MSKNIDTKLAIKAVENAYFLQKPDKSLILHSDLGSQYTSLEFKEYRLAIFQYIESWYNKERIHSYIDIDPIHACQNIADSNKRFIKLRMYSKNNKLCIDIRNSYQTEPIFHQGLPVSKEQGHGYGTKSMVHIVEKHGGVYQFSVKDGWFIFQATA